MNYSHLHLLLNHIPVVGIPLALCFLAYGYAWKNEGAQKFALVSLVALAALTLPTYFTGEPAEELVEHLPGVAESFIESHEEAAEVALIFTLITGVAASATLWLGRARLVRYTVLGTMLAALVATLSLGYVANLGGKIRHTEIRNGAGIPPSMPE